MPVQSPITPTNPGDLGEKIITAPRSEEGNSTIIAEVKSHLGKSGRGTYHHTVDYTREVDLMGSCIVFLIRGKFEVGETTVSGDGLGHPVEDEKVLRLQQYTAVVIINTY